LNKSIAFLGARIFTDIVCAFKLPAFEIVQGPPFDCADLLAEEEVRDDDAEEEGDGGMRRSVRGILMKD